MNELKNLIELSHYAGNRWDLVQAGGGNTSVKIDNVMYIKASGYLLAEINEEVGIAKVDLEKIQIIHKSDKIVNCVIKKKREILTAELVNEATLSKKFKPSIETLLHSLLDKYVLHTHAVVANLMLVQQDWIEKLLLFFPNAIFVKYQTPGIDLAIELEKQLRIKNDQFSKIIFLQNHGVIISSNSHDEVIEISDYISNTLEKALNLDFSHYRYSNTIVNYLKSIKKTNDFVVFYSELISDKYKLIEKFTQPISPDVFVFCGYEIIDIEENFLHINYYFEKFNEYPKILKNKSSYYIVGSSIKKAKEQEELLTFQLFITQYLDKSNINYTTLSSEEMFYLGNWDAEKFRQKL